MNKTDTGLEPSNDERLVAILAAEVTDEALEAAACTGPQRAKAFTVGLCTVMSDCSA
jgi:hypothetical protein